MERNNKTTCIVPHWESEPDVLVIEERKTEQKNNPALVLINDDINTFDHVIKCLMKYCGHTYEQAGQCVLITHTKGQCDVKHGTYEELRPVYEALLDNHLKAKIEM